MARLSGASLVFVLVLAGCQTAGPSGPPESASPTIGPSPTGLASAVPPRSPAAPTPTPAPVCAKGPLSVQAFLGADIRCYVTEDVAVVGWWGPGRTDEVQADLSYRLRSSIPFSAYKATDDFLFVAVDDVAEPSGWDLVDGIHWATITGRRSTTTDRACHYDGAPEVGLTRHCPSYLVAERIVESDPPAEALAGCATLPISEAGSVEADAFSEYPAECFGSRDMTVRGWLDVVYLITGWEEAWGIAPGWLWVPIGPWTVVAPGSNPETSDALTVYSDPARGLDLRATNRWVELTGHYEDAKAETCHVEYDGGYDAARDGPRISDSIARRMCELHFVVTSVRATEP